MPTVGPPRPTGYLESGFDADRPSTSLEPLFSSIIVRGACAYLILQARVEFGTECRGKRGCSSCTPSFSRVLASGSYSTWLIRDPAEPHTSFSWFSWAARSVLPTVSAFCGHLSFCRF